MRFIFCRPSTSMTAVVLMAISTYVSSFVFDDGELIILCV
jgi:hypothetical protein